MSSTALVTMIVVLTIVWGGFLLALTAAIRRETRDRSNLESKNQQES